MPLLNLEEIWPKLNIPLKKFVSATPLKPLSRMLWNSVVMKNIRVQVHIHRKFCFDFFLRAQLKLLPKYTISCNLCETGLPWMTEKLFNRISFWQWTSKCCTNVTITCSNQLLSMCIRLLLIFDYDFLSDCPPLMHDIAFHYVQHCKQCWSMGYVSLLTLSFIVLQGLLAVIEISLFLSYRDYLQLLKSLCLCLTGIIGSYWGLSVFV